MEEKTKKFLKKIRFDTYIYTMVFIVLSITYFTIYDVRTEPVMMLLAAFAFYTVGKQVNLISRLESGEDISTAPRAPLWVRFVTYVTIIIMACWLFFAP